MSLKMGPPFFLLGPKILGQTVTRGWGRQGPLPAILSAVPTFTPFAPLLSMAPAISGPELLPDSACQAHSSSAPTFLRCFYSGLVLSALVSHCSTVSLLSSSISLKTLVL